MKQISVIFLSLAMAGLAEQTLDPRYHSLSEIEALLDSLSQTEEYQDIFRVDTIGYSAQDTIPILAVKISDNVHEKEDEPRVLFLGQCHAEEILGVESVLDFIMTMLDPEPSMLTHVQVLREELETWIVPTYNPEGLNVVHEELDVSFRKNKADFSPQGPYPNGFFDFDSSVGNDVDGVDLNRNYDFNWVFGDSFLAIDPTDYGAHYDYYRGTAPFSEPEVRAIRDLALKQDFLFSIAWHSSRSGRVSEKVISSWNWDDKRTPDDESQKGIADELAGRLQKEGSNEFYESVYGSSRNGNAHNWFYTSTGSFQYLVECGTSNLQPDSALIEDTIERLEPGMLYLMDRAIGYGEDATQITGIVSDAATGLPLEGAEVIIEQLSGGVLKPRLTDEFGRFRRVLSEGSYDLTVQKQGFYPVSLEVTANTGSVTTENISMTPKSEVTINLTIDMDHHFTRDFYPLCIASSELTVDTISVEEGSNSFSLPTGNWNLMVFLEEEDYFPWIMDFELAGDTSIAINLKEIESVSHLNFSESTSWTNLGGDWTLGSDTLKSQSGNFYENGEREDTLEIRTQWFDMTGMQQVALEFSHRYELEWDVDSLFLSLLNGQDSVLAEWSATDQHWHSFRKDRIVARDTSGFDSVRVRLRFSRDNSVNYRGWEIASLHIMGLDDTYLSIAESGPQIRSSFSVSNPYPNPSTGMISIDMEQVRFPLQITVYNLLGQEVFRESVQKGFRDLFTWRLNMVNQPGVPLSSGVYFLRFSTPNKEFIRKCVFLHP